MQIDLPIDSLTKLKAWVKEPRYAGFKLIRDSAGQPLRLRRQPAQEANSEP